jgi:hypothetical protein
MFLTSSGPRASGRRMAGSAPRQWRILGRAAEEDCATEWRAPSKEYEAGLEARGPMKLER